MGIPLLASDVVAFPHPSEALASPDGLLAAGGELTPEWLITAYAQGIFPWFNDDDEYIYWWSPSQRAVLHPGQMRITKSLAKRIRNAGFDVTLDTHFEQVITACANTRQHSGTWITSDMQQAYAQLHTLGIAHCVGVTLNSELVGGLYGVSLGRFFFGESMFSKEKDASKVAFYWLQKQLQAWSFELIDCQLENPHLSSLGVQTMPREQFLDILLKLHQEPLQQSLLSHQGIWQFDEHIQAEIHNYLS